MLNFAITDIEQTYPPSSVKIVVTTNIPCRLILYFTDIEPQRHPTSVTQRGLTVLWGVYYCFVGWRFIVQEENYDSLIHTFIITPWASCETKWFAFRGFVNGQLSPSVSCIFKKHRPSPSWFQILSEPWDTSISPPPMSLVLLEKWITSFQPPSYPPSYPDWPMYEPWGTSLTENNPWEQNLPIGGIDYTLYDSLIRLDNPAMDGTGIKCVFPPNHLPLLNPDSFPLHFQAKSLEPTPLSHDAWIAFFIYTTNGVDTHLIELVITRGSWWGDWPSLLWANPTVVGKDYGLDPGPIDLAAFWVWGRIQEGLPSDPSGWYIDNVAIIFEAVEYENTPYLINDKVGFFYPSRLINEPWSS